MNLAPARWTDPWLNGFPYRKPISIAGSTSTLTQHQVNVTPYIYNETGLVGSWHFSESSGNATADSSGQGNTGYQYGTNRTTDGKFGNAMKFDGVDDYVEITDSSSLHASYGITIEAWVKINKLPASTAAIIEKMKTSAATNSWTARLESGGDIRWQVSNGAVDIGMVSNPLRLGEWVHYAFVYDPSNTIMYIYVNGTQDNSYTYSGITGINVNDKNVRMGFEGGGNNYFNGTIDEVRIYNRTLSASEIQQQYQASKARLDYADIRFTDATGTALLPFWMESDGKFWVKVPSIPTTGTTIYAYYGNPQANDAQNGTGTFEFFDDFNVDLSKWNYGGGTPTLSGSVVTIPTSGGTYLRSNTLFGTNTIVREKVSVTSAAAYAVYGFSDVISGISNHIAGAYNNYGSSTTIAMNRNSGAETYYNTGSSYTGYHTYEFRRVGSASVDMYVDNNFVYSNPGNVPTVDISAGFWAQSIDILSDWVLVRKYASPEPSATQGTETSLTTMAGSAQNWTWKVPTVGDKVRSGGAQDWNWKPYQQYLGRYRKPISISGSGSTLTDYQVNVTPYIYNETGLVGSWHFENNGTDSSGFGNNANYVTTVSTAGGRFGNAMSFNVNQFISVPTSNSLSLSGPFTVLFWIKTTASQSDKGLVSKWSASTGYLFRAVSNYVNFGIDSLGAEATTTSTINDGVWHQIVGVYNSSTAAVYFDAAKQAEIAKTAMTTNTADLNIGTYGSSNAYTFNGTIDEVRIYNRTLSASEIQQQYQAGKARLDYADVRFTDSDGSTPLPFWMESDGKFWVKVPSIPTTGTTIYAYYGNPSANDAQNATGTFETFIENKIAAFNTAEYFGIGYTVQGKIKLKTPITGSLFWGWGRDADTYKNRIFFQTWAGSSVNVYNTMVGAPDNTIYTSLTDGVAHGFSISRISQYNTYYTFDTNSATRTEDASTYLTGMGLYATGNAIDVSYPLYYMFVRKYASPEPSATQGTEEDSPIPQNITVPVGGATNWTWYPS